MSAGAPELEEGAVEIDRVLPAPPEVVWNYLVDPALRSRWLGPGTLELRPSGHLDLEVQDESGRRQHVRGTVLESLPTRRLELQWTPDRGVPENVVFELSPVPAGTRLRILHRQADRRGAGALLPVLLLGPVTSLASRLASVDHPPAPGAATGGPDTSNLVRRGGASSPSRPFGGLSSPAHRSLAILTIGAVILASGLAVGLVGWHYLGALRNSTPLTASCSLAPANSFSTGPSVAGDVGWNVRGNATCEPFTDQGRPVVFFLSSNACPYCDASSWALARALAAFGIGVGSQFTTSSPTDIYPGTPGIDLAGAGSMSPFLSWDPKVGTNNQQISIPSVGLPEVSYVSAYDSAGEIPFLVVGGVAYHLGTLQDPQLLLNGSGASLSPAEVEQNLSSGHGMIYDAVNATQNYLEAYFAEADLLGGIALPTQVASDTVVMAIVTSMP